MISAESSSASGFRLWLAGVIELARRRARRRRRLIAVMVVLAAALGVWAAGSRGSSPQIPAGSVSGATAGGGIPALQLRPGQAIEVTAVNVARVLWPNEHPVAGGGFLGGSGQTRGFVSYRQIGSLTTAYDGSGRTSMASIGGPTFIGTTANRALWEHDYRQHRTLWNDADSPRQHTLRFQHGFYFGGRNVTYQQLLDVPRNGRALDKLIRAYCAQSGADPITVIDPLLTETALPAEQRASIIHAALGCPGIHIEHGVRDPLGRVGDALATQSTRLPPGELPGRYGVSQLIFDPHTYSILAEGGFLVGSANVPGVPANFSMGWRAYTSATLITTAHVH
jgi:hypothetical protein